jgi:phage regulator Rha-like protein
VKASTGIEHLILTIRNQRVILAGDLAMVYGAETRRLNEQVRRNAARFPRDFVFQLKLEEFEALKTRHWVSSDGRAALRSQNAILKRGQHIKFPPYAFTEHGAIMAAMVLSSPEALAMSVYVVRAFVSMRERLAANEAILRRLAEIDRTLLQHDASLRRAVSESMAHYHAERNHQGLENRRIRACPRVAMNNGQVHRRQRLGGMLNFHYRKAA